MNPYKVVLRDSEFFVTCSFSSKEKGPFETQAEAELCIRDDYDCCHLSYCNGALDWYGRCTNCGSNGVDLAN
jgi:hypothetical protein